MQQLNADDLSIQVKSSGVSPKLQYKTVNSQTYSQSVKADSGYDGLSQVWINGLTYQAIEQRQQANITAKGCTVTKSGISSKISFTVDFSSESIIPQTLYEGYVFISRTTNSSYGCNALFSVYFNENNEVFIVNPVLASYINKMYLYQSCFENSITASISNNIVTITATVPDGVSEYTAWTDIWQGNLYTCNYAEAQIYRY